MAQWYKPRKGGMWRETLRVMKEAWKRGQETEYVTDKICWLREHVQSPVS